MSDTFGALALPVAGTGEPRSEAIGDPCLDVLASFFKAVINASAGAAWAVLQPKTSVLAANKAFTHNPEERALNARDLPALYLYRAPGEYEDTSIGYHAHTGALVLRWIYPRAPQEEQRQRDPFANAVAKVIAAAIRAGRHSSWVVDSDLEDVDAIRLAAPTATLPQVLTTADMNGVIGAGTVHAARPVIVTTSAAPGAYNTSEPIRVTMLLEDGREFVESLYITNPNGGESITGIWNASRTTLIEVPGQALTTGTLTFGYADSPEADLGSLVSRYAGLSKLTLRRGAERRQIVIRSKTQDGGSEDNERGKALFDLDCLQFDIGIEELLTEDVDAKYDQLGDGPDSVGSNLTIEKEGGVVWSTDYLEMPTAD